MRNLVGVLLATIVTLAVVAAQSFPDTVDGHVAAAKVSRCTKQVARSVRVHSGRARPRANFLSLRIEHLHGGWIKHKCILYARDAGSLRQWRNTSSQNPPVKKSKTTVKCYSPAFC